MKDLKERGEDTSEEAVNKEFEKLKGETVMVGDASADIVSGHEFVIAVIDVFSFIVICLLILILL